MAVLRDYIMVNSKAGATCNNSKKFKLVVIKFCQKTLKRKHGTTAGIVEVL